MVSVLQKKILVYLSFEMSVIHGVQEEYLDFLWQEVNRFPRINSWQELNRFQRINSSMNQCLFSYKITNNDEKNKAMEKHINLQSNNKICKKRKMTTPDAKKFCFSSEKIFNMQAIRGIILDHLELCEGNHALFIEYGNEEYFKRRSRFKNINKRTKRSRTIDITVVFYLLRENLCLLKTRLRECQFQNAWVFRAPFLAGTKWTLEIEEKNTLTVHFVRDNEVILQQMFPQKIIQFYERSQFPWKNEPSMQFIQTNTIVPIMTAKNHIGIFNLNKQKELTLSSYNITINSLIQDYTPTNYCLLLIKSKYPNTKHIEVHFDLIIH